MQEQGSGCYSHPTGNQVRNRRFAKHGRIILPGNAAHKVRNAVAKPYARKKAEYEGIYHEVIITGGAISDIQRLINAYYFMAEDTVR